jgi:Trk K+ transport system NAD-binding subunit
LYFDNNIFKPRPDATSAIGDEVIVAGVPDRLKKFKTPEPIQPTHRW